MARKQRLVLSAASLILEPLTSGRLFGYLARRPGNRASTARCPRGRAGTRCVQVVDARGRRRQKWLDNDRTKAERHRRGAPCPHHRIVRTYPVRRAAGTGADTRSGTNSAGAGSRAPTRTHPKNGRAATSPASSTSASSASGGPRVASTAGRGWPARTAARSTPDSGPDGGSGHSLWAGTA